MQQNELKIKNDEETRQIIFQNCENDWIIKIDKKGIHFNREGLPNVDPESFADMFINIMENIFEVTFKKKE